MIVNTNSEQRNPNIIKNQPLTLNCKTDGIPHPKIKWFRNNTIINSDDYLFIHNGETLRILQTKEKHGGLYVCRAENIGGSKNKTFNVTVLVPPYMNPSPARSEISHSLYENIRLSCPALGFPKPWISWYKDSRLLTNGSRIEISLNQTKLFIKNATSQDAGIYTCTAVNEAGSSEKELLLTILIPPKITAIELADKQLPILHQSVRLVCKVEGYPIPFVTWFKNENILNSDHVKSYYIHGQGHILEIESLHSLDNGLYTCFAESNAGMVEENFLLDILDPPTIANSTQTISANLGDSVDIKCLVSGDPLPKVSWLKNGHPIDNMTEIGFTETNTVLRINSANKEHHARYTCIATNQVGSVEQDFHLNIQIHPFFENGGDEQVSTAVNRPLKLNCPAKGEPLPYITWYKEGHPIMATDNIFLNGNSLQIHRSSPHHEGIYTCKARNAAGSIKKYFKVMITVPPTILNNEQTTYLSVLINESAEMTCVVEGMPTPSIMWKKDGQLIDKSHSYVTLHNDNTNLSIPNTTIEHGGTYQCIATNIMGNSSKNFALSVLNPPTIEKSKEEMKAILGESTMIECNSKGFPSPEVTWMKNDKKLESISTYHYINEKGSLHFYSLKEDDSSNYTCIASNEAGSANSTISLSVLIPPVIEDSRSDVHVLIGHASTLECKVKGFPHPHVIWLKGTKMLHKESDYTQLESGSLFIPVSNPSDSGQYICTAENEAGVTRVTRNLYVESPAIIRDDFLEEVTIIQGKDLELECPAEGYPVPRILWEKDSESINLLQPRYHLQNSGSLLITTIQSEDGGTYQCIAENGVGKDVKIVNVIVYVPAVIQQDQAIPTIEAPQGGNVVLPCDVSGFPPPEITWQHNGQHINNDFHSGIHSGDLQLNNLKPEDGGQYVCTATNDAGQDFWEVNVQVLIPPTITVLPENQNISIGAQFTLNCEARGFPTPTVTWYHNNEKISEEQQISGGKSSFTKLHAENEDSGIYTCIAQNSVGEKKVEVSVHIRVDGNWAHWNEWSPCSRSCGAGTRIRKRMCDSPAPNNGGRYCLGLSQQTDYCNNNHCPIHGGWSTWSSWGECSATCSGGQRKSFRTCTNPTPSQGGRPCVGPSYKTEFCNVQSCSDSPNQVLANLIGELNELDISLSKIEANITKDESKTKFTMALSNIPENIGHWIKVIVPLEPLYWVKAFEIGQAMNGYSLTKGFFSSDTDITFPSGKCYLIAF
ncbi:hemicentin-1-like isoform X2 [Centruroides sculpturatus]|nr:hemicentin-1-like isoform X2 [Centruroides sculpturatus]